MAEVRNLRAPSDRASSPSLVADSSKLPNLSHGAHQVFDEMRKSEFGDWRPPSRALVVTIYKAWYPITESVLHQVVDPFGVVKDVYVCKGVDCIKAHVLFQLKHQAAEAFSNPGCLKPLHRQGAPLVLDRCLVCVRPCEASAHGLETECARTASGAHVATIAAGGCTGCISSIDHLHRLVEFIHDRWTRSVALGFGARAGASYPRRPRSPVPKQRTGVASARVEAPHPPQPVPGRAQDAFAHSGSCTSASGPRPPASRSHPPASWSRPPAPGPRSSASLLHSPTPGAARGAITVHECAPICYSPDDRRRLRRLTLTVDIPNNDCSSGCRASKLQQRRRKDPTRRRRRAKPESLARSLGRGGGSDAASTCTTFGAVSKRRMPGPFSIDGSWGLKKDFRSLPRHRLQLGLMRPPEIPLLEHGH